MAIAYFDPDGGGQFDKFSQKAEALLRRKRQEREEEIRREQRKADAATARQMATEWDRRAAAFTAAEQPFHVAHDLRVSADAARAVATAILEGK